MDGYGQIGPEKGTYDEDLKYLADRLYEFSPVFVKLADRGTQYELFLFLARSLDCPFGTPDGIEYGDPEKEELWLHVSKPRQGAAWFKLDAEQHASYVNETMGFTANGDGEVIAAFLTRLGKIVYRMANP